MSLGSHEVYSSQEGASSAVESSTLGSHSTRGQLAPREKDSYFDIYMRKKNFAACDGGTGAEFLPSPPVVQIPEEPLEAPELHPAPPEIPVLDQPLLPEIQIQDELYRRFLVNTIGEFPSLERISETVRVQSQIERQVEAALVHHGFREESILMNRHLIRGFVFYHRGRALSPRTYRAYLNEISRLGTRDTRAFQRIIRAIQNSDLFL
ncbi:hypothetical protein ACFE04_019656 [Oxalis oulophora]